MCVFIYCIYCDLLFLSLLLNQKCELSELIKCTWCWDRKLLVVLFHTCFCCVGCKWEATALHWTSRSHEESSQWKAQSPAGVDDCSPHHYRGQITWKLFKHTKNLKIILHFSCLNWKAVYIREYVEYTLQVVIELRGSRHTMFWVYSAHMGELV